MGDEQYIADRLTDAVEQERLSLLARLMDPLTQRRLEAIGIKKGGYCLEVGAGHGSVARWLAERVGPQGRVVATDTNPRFLRELAVPNLEVRQHDIVTDKLETSHYDLVHCRFVLQHLTQPERAVHRMAAAVRPGGWLCIEEGDYGTLGAANPAHPAAAQFTQKWKTAFDALRTAGIVDLYFGRRVRDLVDDCNFVEVQHEGVTWINRGGEAGARFMQMNLALARQPLVAAGVLTEEDCRVLEGAGNDPFFTFVDATFFAAWGRRAS